MYVQTIPKQFYFYGAIENERVKNNSVFLVEICILYLEIWPWYVFV